MRSVHREMFGTKSTMLGSAAVLTGLAIAAPATGAAGDYVISGQKIGTYRVGAAFVEARSRLGGPYSETQSGTQCIARWPTGVTIAWKRRLPYSVWQKACIVFRSAKVEGKLWRTDKGLRIGASDAALKRLYPGAHSAKADTFTVWSLATSSKFTLQAWSRGRHVAFFRLRG